MRSFLRVSHSLDKDKQCTSRHVVRLRCAHSNRWALVETNNAACCCLNRIYVLNNYVLKFRISSIFVRCTCCIEASVLYFFSIVFAMQSSLKGIFVILNALLNIILANRKKLNLTIFIKNGGNWKPQHFCWPLPWSGLHWRLVAVRANGFVSLCEEESSARRTIPENTWLQNTKINQMTMLLYGHDPVDQRGDTQLLQRVL